MRDQNQPSKRKPGKKRKKRQKHRYEEQVHSTVLPTAFTPVTTSELLYYQVSTSEPPDPIDRRCLNDQVHPEFDKIFRSGVPEDGQLQVQDAVASSR
jgi:hypothetical protein